MKVLALASVLALSTSVLAASDSSLNDLQYVPNAGTLYGSSQVRHLKYDAGENNDLYQRLGYSFTDNLFTDVLLNYSLTGNGDGYDALGDIVFNGRYRMISNGDKRFDLIGGVSISPEDADFDGDKGNNFSGGHALRVGAEYGSKTNERQWSVGAYYVYNLEAKTDFSSGDTDTDEAHGELSFAANLLTRLSEKCYFKTLAGVGFTEKYDVDNKFGDYEVEGLTVWNLGGEYQHFINNNLYLNLGAQILLTGDSSDGAIMSYTTGANYQF